MATGNKILVAMRSWVEEQLAALRAWIDTSLVNKANEAEVLAALAGKMQHGAVSLGNYATVLEMASSVPVDTSVFAVQGCPLNGAADSPIPGINAEIQYLVLMDYGPRHTVIATQYIPADGIVRTWKRQIYDDHWMQDAWTQDATATKPQEYDLPLAAGYRPSDYVTYCKSQFGRVYLDIGGIRRTDNALIPQFAPLCTLPSGYRPKRDLVRSVDFLDASGAPAGVGHIHIQTTGVVYVAAVNSNTYGVMGEYEFWAAA